MSLRAVRRMYITGDAHRSISSTGVEQSDGSSRSSSRWSGFSISASIPCEMRLRVVSLPATASSSKNRSNSMSVSRSPSTSAWSSTLMMSSDGLARFWLGELVRVPEHLDGRALWRPRARPRTPGPRSRSSGCDHSKSLWRSSCGHAHHLGDDLERQLGRDVDDEVALAALGDAVDDRRGDSRMRSCSRPIMRGVKPLLTSSRSRVCFGGSIISIIIRCCSRDSSRALVERDAPLAGEHLRPRRWLTRARSSYRVMHQKPRLLGLRVEVDGASRRRRSNWSWGTRRRRRCRGR